MKTKYLLLLLLTFPLNIWAQLSPEELVEGLQTKMATVNGFEATALITVDIDFIDISPREVKIKYTAPDQFEFDAKGIALLPKNGMKMEYIEMLNGANTTISAGEEEIRGIGTQKLKVIPESIESEIVLAQLWMNPETFQILKMQTFTRESGSYIIDFYFDDATSIFSSKLIVSFDIENLTAPAQMIAEFMGNAKVSEEGLPKVAKVIVEYKDLKINLK